MTAEPLNASRLSDRVATLEARWRRARRRRRIAILGTTVLAIVLVLVAFDAAFRPTRGVRFALLLGAVLAAGVTIARRARSLRPTRDDFARWLARTNGVAEDVVRSAVAFETDGAAGGDPAEAASLRARVCAEAGRAIDALPRPRRTRRLAIAALVIGGALAAFAIVDPTTARIGAARALWLADARYPTATRVTLRDHDPARAITVARGRRLRVMAAVDGAPVDTVTLHRVWRDRTTRVPLRRDPRGRFTGEIGPMLDDESFFLTGGDDVDRHPLYRVSLRHPPSVADVDATAHPPAYTKRPAIPLPTPAWRFPDGSAVALTVTTDRPVARARVILSTDRDDPRTVPLTRHAPTRFGARFDVGDASHYAIELFDASDLDNRPAPPHRIHRVPDAPPRVTLSAAITGGLVTPDAVLRIACAMTDDYGVQAARVELYPEGAPERGDRVDCEPAARVAFDLALASRRIRGAVGPRAPEIGDRLSLRAVATDARAQRGRSAAIRFTVAPARVVERRLLAGVRAVSRLLGETAAAIDHAAARREKATRDLPGWASTLARSATRLASLADAYAINRLPGSSGAQLRDAARRITAAAAIVRTADTNGTERLGAASVPLREAERILARFASFRDAVRHTARAADMQARVDLALHAATPRATRLAADVERVRRAMTLGALALDTLAARGTSPLAPPPETLATWATALRGPAIDRLVAHLTTALASADPESGDIAAARDPSRRLARHLRQLAAEMAEVGAAVEKAAHERARRAAKDAAKGPKPDVLDRATSFNRDLAKADRERGEKRASALERLKQDAKRLAEALDRAEGDSLEDPSAVERAHPETMQQMMDRVRDRLERADTRRAVVLSEQLVKRLRARADRSRPANRPIPGEREDARPPDPDGQNMGGDYRPESGIAGAERVATPRRVNAKERLRWGVLPPASGGGARGVPPTEAPARYRDAVRRYYEKLAEANR